MSNGSIYCTLREDLLTDVILIKKTDLVSAAELKAIEGSIRGL